jgi:hypothetical protein
MWKRFASLVETRFRDEDTDDRRRPTPARPQRPVAVTAQAQARAPAPKQLQPRTTAAPRLVRDFRAVSIAPKSVACPAAKQVNGKRFLIREAPRLPLAGCTLPEQCRCRYDKHDDRRQHDRRHPYGNGLGIADPDAERRQKKTRGRRATDL